MFNDEASFWPTFLLRFIILALFGVPFAILYAKAKAEGFPTNPDDFSTMIIVLPIMAGAAHLINSVVYSDSNDANIDETALMWLMIIGFILSAVTAGIGLSVAKALSSMDSGISKALVAVLVGFIIYINFDHLLNFALKLDLFHLGISNIITAGVAIIFGGGSILLGIFAPQALMIVYYISFAPFVVYLISAVIDYLKNR